MINDVWLFIEHGDYHTWTRAHVPAGVRTVRDLIGYLQHGGRVVSDWMVIPERARFIPRTAGMTVLAKLVEQP